MDPDRGLAIGEYGFLAGRAVDTATLAQAVRLAHEWGVLPHEAMLALGWVSSEAYVRLLAAQFGVQVAAPGKIGTTVAPAPFAGRAMLGNRGVMVLDAMAAGPGELARLIRQSGLPRGEIALASAGDLRAARLARERFGLLRRAVFSLLREAPHASAARGPGTRQLVLLASLFGLLTGGLAVAPDAALAAWTALLVLPFFCVTLLRLTALAHLLGPGRVPRETSPPRIPERELPIYSVLVPLYREAGMLPGLIAALGRLDYPAAKLDIKLVLEASDAETRAALATLELPGNVEVVVVPDALPRTKPKALNYALPLARGEYVTIYDAEDEPEPGQLREAVAAFRTGPPTLGCLQARLNVFNARDGWLTRQFALEYSAQFDALLPSLARLGLPLPLGGTSNHFRRDALVAVGGWDPFNVTEDADLGLRLHRQGWRTGTLVSTTWEEAPVRLGSWLRQRTRWLKGWMQTWLVHTREHRRLMQDIGPRGAFAVHVLLGGVILSCLVHPIFYGLMLAELLAGEVLGRPQSLMGAGFWHMAVLNLAVGFLAAIALAALAALRRGFGWLALWALTMPLYWLLISAAAYRAAWQLMRDPFLWEKTEHGQSLSEGRRVRRTARGSPQGHASTR
jgi:cellulose synthase/poly-beta-1,6-N-acetylglucosamine synthase-like glycosyltransferase